MEQYDFIFERKGLSPDFYADFCRFCNVNGLDTPIQEKYYPSTSYLFFDKNDISRETVLGVAVLYLIQDAPVATIGFCSVARSVRRIRRKHLIDFIINKIESAAKDAEKELIMALPAHFSWRDRLRSVGYCSDSSLFGGVPIVSDLHMKKLCQ